MVHLKTALLAGAFMAAASVGIARADSITFTSNAGATNNPLSFTVGGGTGNLTGWEYTPNNYVLDRDAIPEESRAATRSALASTAISTTRSAITGAADMAAPPFGVIVIDLGASGALRTDAANGTLGLSFNSVQSPDAGGVYYESSAPSNFFGTYFGPDLKHSTADLTINSAQDNGANPLFAHTNDEFLYITTDINNANQVLDPAARHRDPVQVRTRARHPRPARRRACLASAWFAGATAAPDKPRPRRGKRRLRAPLFLCSAPSPRALAFGAGRPCATGPLPCPCRLARGRQLSLAMP